MRVQVSPWAVRVDGVAPMIEPVVASVSDPRMFKSSRQFAAWLGLVPRQYTTGGKVKLGRITKRGDQYLRTCLVHGARAVVALAARNARLIWTLMVKQESYRAMPVSES